MSAPLESWKVLPHGQSSEVDDPRAALRRPPQSLR